MDVAVRDGTGGIVRVSRIRRAAASVVVFVTFTEVVITVSVTL